MTNSPIPLRVVGWRARAALARAGHVATPLAPLSESLFLEAGSEIVWLGRPGAALHGRAMLTDAPLPRDAGSIRLESDRAEVWTAPPALPLPPRARLVAAARALLESIRDAESPPPGLAALLTGGVPPFPLDGAVRHLAALAGTCETGRARLLAEAAEPLLGLGPGLTPSGDDLVGGVLFTRRVLGGKAPPRGLVARARARTHPVSAALLADLAAGHGHAPLHALAGALASGHAEAAAEAAHELTIIGHTSGWDMLAGVLLALAGREAIGAAPRTHW